MKTEELEAVYHQVKSDLMGYLMSLCANQADAEDVFQTVFLKFIQIARDRDMGRAEVRPYLFRMARNYFVDVYRRRKTEQARVDDLTRDYEHAPPADREVDAESELGARIHGVVDRVLRSDDLNERRREILRLRIKGRARMEEIAETLGISRSSAYRELEAALTLLRRALVQEGLSPAQIQGQP